VVLVELCRVYRIVLQGQLSDNILVPIALVVDAMKILAVTRSFMFSGNSLEVILITDTGFASSAGKNIQTGDCPKALILR
jgi:hypothetical protein